MENDPGVALIPQAFALRPVRVDVANDCFIYYDAITFPGGPWSGCEIYLRRCKACGYLKDDGSNLIIDVLDCDGSIIQDYPITRDGFNYLRRQLKFQRRPDPCIVAEGS
jgi:hypothetical protein